MHHLHSLLDEANDTFDVGVEPPGADAGDAGPLRFRAPTVDEALAEATHEFGHDVEILEANRIRRGGVGGFFATDLGVEIVVAPPDPPAPRPARLAVPDRPMPSSSDVARHRRSSAGRSGAERRPQFYDRVVEEPDEPDVGAPVPVSRSGPITNAAASAPVPPPTPPTDDAASAPVPPPTRRTRPRRVRTTVHRCAPPPRNDAGPSVERPTDEAGALVSSTVAKLVDRLSATAPVDGSRLGELSAVRVRLTTDVGAILEVTAELGGPGG